MANYTMDDVLLWVEGGSCVTPVAAIGCCVVKAGETNCVLVVAWDSNSCEFVLENGVEITHGQITFGEYNLVPPPQASSYPVPPTGTYVETSLWGNGAKLTVPLGSMPSGVVKVRFATRVLFMLSDWLTGVSRHAPIYCAQVNIQLQCGMVFTVRDVSALGGAMAFVDALLTVMADCGITWTGDPQVYELTNHGASEVLLALRNLQSRTEIDLMMIGNFNTTGAAAVGNKFELRNDLDSNGIVNLYNYRLVVDCALMSPWRLPCTWPELCCVIFDKPLPLPPLITFKVIDGKIDFARILPAACHGNQKTVDAPTLVRGLRSGRFMPCSGNRYYERTLTLTEIVCPIDLTAVQKDVDHASFLHKIGCGFANVRLAIPLCPDDILTETFGRDYDATAGLVTR